MLFKVVLKSVHPKADLGGFVFNLLPWKERSREGACLQRLETKDATIPRGVCTDFLKLAMRKSKLVERGIAHAPEIKE